MNTSIQNHQLFDQTVANAAVAWLSKHLTQHPDFLCFVIKEDFPIPADVEDPFELLRRTVMLNNGQVVALSPQTFFFKLATCIGSILVHEKEVSFTIYGQQKEAVISFLNILKSNVKKNEPIPLIED